GAHTHPNASYIYWWPNDGYAGCACERCAALTDPLAPPYATHSRLIWDYILRLSAAVQEKWPDKVLKVPLYSTYGTIPDGVRVPDNVSLNVVKFGTGRYSAAYFKEPAYFQSALDEVAEFNRRSKQKIWVWVHYPHAPRIQNGLMAPYPVPHFMQRYMAANRDSLCGLYLNGHYTSSWAMDGLMVYFWYKLLWNPDFDVDAATEEYVRTLWGPVADPVLRFYRTIISRWESVLWKDIPSPEAFDYINPDLAFSDTYPTAIREELKALLESAVTQAPETSLYRDRAQYLLAGHEPFFARGEAVDRKQVRRAPSVRRTPVLDGNLEEWEGQPALDMLDNLTLAEAPLRSAIRTSFDDEAFYVAGDIELDGGFAGDLFPAGSGREQIAGKA
ncbi:MAG: DUF4838 domain-containing protein, partial [Kiritimatiellia bacterium]|nr:DUF4838 domain-containing protein [Kiritimatiellia bacterium]